MTWNFDLQLFGGSNTSGIQNSANQLSSEQSGVFNQLLGLLGGMQGQAGQYTSLGGPLAGLWQQILGPGGAGGMAPQDMAQFMNLAMNPSALAGASGINAGGLVGNATNYLSNTGGTNLAQFTPGAMSQLGAGQSALNMAGPQAMNFYRNEMTQGINPQFAENAQNQLQQQFGQGLNTALANAGPGQNTNALTQGMTNQLLSSSANLGGQLAGEGQQFANQGAAGLTSTAQGMDVNNLQRIMSQAQLAGGLDAQTMNMLTQAANMGVGYNQTVLGNAQAGANMGQSALGGAQGMVNMGNQMNEFAGSQLGGLGQYLGNEAFDYTQLASQIQSQNNPLADIMGMLGTAGGLYGDVATGGFSGFGGKGQVPGASGGLSGGGAPPFYG